MKLHSTTLNLGSQAYDYLGFISAETGLSKKEVILFVIDRYYNSAYHVDSFDRNVEYQPCSCDYMKLHIRFSDDEREINYDMRKMFKLSVSFIVSFSILEYGELLLDPDKEKGIQYYLEKRNSYTARNYEIYSSEESGSKIIYICCKIEEKQKE